MIKVFKLEKFRRDFAVCSKSFLDFLALDFYILVSYEVVSHGKRRLASKSSGKCLV